jgi:hypothetical protein
VLSLSLASPAFLIFGHDKGNHIMLQDYGHATTLDLTPHNYGNVVVHFQIPKALN